MVFIMINGNMPPVVVFAMIALQVAPLLLNDTPFPIRQDQLFLLLGLGYLAYMAFTKRDVLRERGVGGFVLHLLDGLRGSGAAAAQAANEPMNQENNEQYSKMLKTISRLPTEDFKVPAACSIHEVKERLARRGIPHAKCIEKEELVRLLHDFRGGPTASCCICCEDYTDGDVLRILSKCKHDFHLECLDKWALTLANSTRTPSCPLCNQDL
ncbi:Aste57867_1450 [Aphanomyces stellatus]|uniref:RING-type E3 ubiquitin transferase n=1 Tax=Aphanomyces stellatus TaxID=120398 RepID=A0A485K6H0_9STRA|nr:hypothetical protein As57867_001449 [Aphanomyces stellatus]VFT78667.1 Aste57867_1450 [Aphanomyces stellatus]